MTDYPEGDAEFHNHLEEWGVKWHALLATAKASIEQAAALAPDGAAKASLHDAAHAVERINIAVAFYFAPL